MREWRENNPGWWKQAKRAKVDVQEPRTLDSAEIGKQQERQQPLKQQKRNEQHESSEEEEEHDETNTSETLKVEPGMRILVNRRGIAEKGKILFKSKKKVGHWAVKFDSDGKVVAYMASLLAQINDEADANGTPEPEETEEVETKTEPEMKPEKPLTEAQKKAQEFLRAKAEARKGKRKTHRVRNEDWFF